MLFITSAHSKISLTIAYIEFPANQQEQRMIGLPKCMLLSLEIYIVAFQNLSKALKSHLVLQNQHKSFNFTKVE